MKEVKFNLTIEETNLILAALGNLPFSQVSGIIAKLHAQANKQMSELNEKPAVTEIPQNGR